MAERLLYKYEHGNEEPIQDYIRAQGQKKEYKSCIANNSLCFELKYFLACFEDTLFYSVLGSCGLLKSSVRPGNPLWSPATEIKNHKNKIRIDKSYRSHVSMIMILKFSLC